MIDIIMNRCNKNRMQEFPIKDGSLTLTKDSQELFVDMQNERIKITDVKIINDSSTNRHTINAYEGKLYVFTHTQDIWMYTNEWIILTKLDGYLLEYEGEFNTSEGIVHVNADKLVFTVNSTEKVNIPIGTIVTDRNDSIGIIASHYNSNEFDVYVIVDKYRDNTLTHTIYIDSDYGKGDSRGTQNKPYKSLNDISHLSIADNREIYLMNNCIGNNDFSGNNITINGNDYKLEVSNLKSEEGFISIKNTNLTKGSVSGHSVEIKNSSLSSQNNYVEIFSPTIIQINNTNSLTSVYFTGDGDNTSILEISDCNFECLYIEKFSNVYIRNSYIGCLNIHYDSSNAFMNGNEYKGDLYLNDVIIGAEISVNKLNHCDLLGINCVSSDCQINLNCKSITLGEFKAPDDFDITELENNGVEITYLPVYSKQIVDKKIRKYGNTNSSLSSHLDAIDNKLESLSTINPNPGINPNPSIDLNGFYKSEGVINDLSKLKQKIYTKSAIVKYIGESNDLIQSFVLTEDLIPLKVEKVTNALTSDFCFKVSDTNLLNHMSNISGIHAQCHDVDELDPNDMIFNVTIYSFNDNSVTLKFENSSEFNLDVDKITRIEFQYTTRVNTNDRLIYTGIMWDKLCNAEGSFNSLSVEELDLLIPVNENEYICSIDSIDVDFALYDLNCTYPPYINAGDIVGFDNNIILFNELDSSYERHALFIHCKDDLYGNGNKLSATQYVFTNGIMFSRKLTWEFINGSNVNYEYTEWTSIAENAIYAENLKLNSGLENELIISGKNVVAAYHDTIDVMEALETGNVPTGIFTNVDDVGGSIFGDINNHQYTVLTTKSVDNRVHAVAVNTQTGAMYNFKPNIDNKWTKITGYIPVYTTSPDLNSLSEGSIWIQTF